MSLDCKDTCIIFSLNWIFCNTMGQTNQWAVNRRTSTNTKSMMENAINRTENTLFQLCSVNLLFNHIGEKVFNIMTYSIHSTPLPKSSIWLLMDWCDIFTMVFVGSYSPSSILLDAEWWNYCVHMDHERP